MHAPALEKSLIPLLSGFAVAAIACGGSNKPVADTPDGSTAVVCVEPTAGMQITKDTTLCSGTYALPRKANEYAVAVTASDVTVTCDETVIDGAGEYGNTPMPTVGLRIEGQANVTVTGCTVKGYRYGVVALNSENVVLKEVHLDDNFTDPEADWVQDTVQGGGIRFEGVAGGEIVDSSFARNWNGLELRKSRDLTVARNTADHCSNTAATLADSHNNLFEGNDFSWGIRGDELSFAGHWYGVDTKDSAGVIVDAGSSKNRFLDNDLTYGGDGIFVRSIIGGCATDNWFEGNDTSFSPHNAIECWCDRNAFVDNIASSSHYGIWLGGTDEGIVRGNTVDNNLVDGISIQIGEDRHTIIEGNTITNNARVGLLLTGREYQAWHNLNHVAARLANSSHLLIQNNRFAGNGASDIFVSSSRSVVLASNCSSGDGEPSIDLRLQNDLVVTASECGAGDGRTAPSVSLAVPPQASLEQEVTVTAEASPADAPVGPPTYTWLVQQSSLRFPELALPPSILLADSTEDAEQAVSFSAPGVYDVDVTYSDGALGAMAHGQVRVAPEGTVIGANAEDWTYACANATCITTVAVDPAAEAASGGVHITTNAPYDFAAITPATKDLGISSAGEQKLGFFARAWNNNGLGWQGNYPVVVLGGPAGQTRYEPSASLLTTDGREWVYIEVPLAGADSWTRTGPPPTTIDWVEIHVDTYGYEAVDLWIDKLTLY